MIVATTGTPGTGKSEVAKLLAEELGWKFVDLNKMAEEKNLYEGYDEKRNCKIVNIDKLSEEVGKIEEDAIIEGHFSHDMPCDIVIVLRCNPGELRKRLEKRGWPEEKIEENVEAEIMGICKEEAFEKRKKIIEIDTTEKTAQETVKSAKIAISKA